MAFNADTAANPSTDSTTANDERQESATGAPEKRERRSRDRYGRDRRERNTNNDNAPPENASVEGKPAEASEDGTSAPRSYFDRGNTQSSAETPTATTPPSSAPVQPSAPSELAKAPVAAQAQAQAPAGLPKVQAYELPMASLIQVAEGSGLQWVNSDPAKIAQVQAAIAAEPKPVHVPRERPPAVVFDEGPLILVETRKDLSNMKLPF
jgi:ribonuclease E